MHYAHSLSACLRHVHPEGRAVRVAPGLVLGINSDGSSRHRYFQRGKLIHQKSGTFCRDEIQGSHHEKIEACSRCEVYADALKKKSVYSVGLVVDSVSGVINVKSEDIEDAPSFGTKLDTDYIPGMAKTGSGVKILLDIDRVLSC